VLIITSRLSRRTEFGDMSTMLIDPRDEMAAIRRAAVLLERVRQDGKGRDPDVEVLLRGIATLQSAAAAGRGLQFSAIAEMKAVLARTTLPSMRERTGYELLRWNAIVDSRELLGRLTRPRRSPANAQASRAAFADA
jgi:hypothetical protein